MGQPLATLGKNGIIILGSNLKIDICMYIVESIFINNQDVLLRVRLLIEPEVPENRDRIATL